VQALVLSGGWILGAFHAGAIFQALQYGFAPQKAAQMQINTQG
jgi:hypothetical protein